MNKVVKYNNYLNSLIFSNFTQVDMNFFITLCSYMKDKGTDKITFSFNELREITNYTKSNSIRQFASDLEEMNEKLMKITCKLRTEKEVLMFVLFPTFRINTEDQVLTVSVNNDFKFILNEVTKNFTRFELHEFIGLDRKYSKTLYRLLKQYRHTGYYEVSIDDFRKIMDYPENYKNKYVMDKIIKPVLKELKDYFQDLKCEPKYAQKRGRPVLGYIFTFTPEGRVHKKDLEQESKKNPDKNIITKNSFANFHQRTYDYQDLEQELLNNKNFSGDTSDIENMLQNINNKKEVPD